MKQTLAILAILNILALENLEVEGMRLDKYSGMIVSQYFSTKQDFVNFEMVCKKFRGNMEMFHYNAIPLLDDKTRDCVPNIETQYLYQKQIKNILTEKFRNMKFGILFHMMNI